MELRVLSLYPEQMNIYADRGNILFLQRRCEWRGIEFRWEGAGPGTSIDPSSHEVFYIGGGQDRDQRAVAADMVETKQAALTAAVGDGAVLLAVCGGYQLLGESYQLGAETLPGLGLADLRTVREEGPRLIGNVAIETELGGEKRLLAGFENHGGRTYLGSGARPLGRVVPGHGHGNNGGDGFEGVWEKNMVGTYLHGPLLPKNAWLADLLIELALERRYGERPRLEPLADELERAAHASARAAAGV
jgi:lipid II isoglutaminyl synthase (glutamine-hydrolysing)